jgi:hypothetical protein
MKFQKLSSFLSANIYDIFVVIVLTIFAAISFSLILSESVTGDEYAHIPAAYGYTVQHDFTLNPEHPPLAKLISGTGFVGSHFTYPTDLMHQNIKTADLQWKAGFAFLYYTPGNNPDAILFRTRTPILLASVIGLLFCYILLAKVSGKKVAALATFFTAFSPTVIAHGHLVTNDVLMMTTSTIAVLCFIRFLQNRTWLTGSLAALTMAIAEISKFSAFLLFFFYVLVTILYYLTHNRKSGFIKSIKYSVKVLWPVYLLVIILVYLVYSFEVFGLSHAAQDQWIINTNGEASTHMGTRVLLDINQFPPAAPMVRYVNGFVSSLVRVADGHGANLFGKDYVKGTPIYFPVVSLLKTPTPMILIWMMIFGYALSRISQVKLSLSTYYQLLLNLIRKNPVPTFGALFVAIYFLSAIVSTLDIGIRHLMPIFTWMSYLTALWIIHVLAKLKYKDFLLGKFIAGILIASYGFIALAVFPNYLSYTTEIAGGSANSYRYYNDSNVDWGQSYKAFGKYLKQHPEFTTIYTDTISIEAKNYYTCGSVQPSGCPRIRHLDKALPPAGSYVALGEMQLTIDWANPQGRYASLKHQTPIAKIGDAVYVYYLTK